MKRINLLSGVGILCGAAMLAGCGDLAGNLDLKDGEVSGGISFHLREDGFVQETIDAINEMKASAEAEIATATFSNAGEITVGFMDNTPPDSDVVFVIDNTGSMMWAIDSIKSDVVAAMKASPGRRYGAVAFRDKGDDYVVKTTAPLGSTLDQAVAGVEVMEAGGGGDFPESVASAIDEALNAEWSVDKERHLILIGDAPDHEYPEISMASVGARAKMMNVKVHVVGLPCGDECKKEIGAD